MKYMGSKARLAKYILPIILKNIKDGMYYVEPFVGGANMIDKVEGCSRIGSDVNPYLIACLKALAIGWIPPMEITRDVYNEVRSAYNGKSDRYQDYYTGYIGFSGSYGGRFFEGGYAGTVVTKTGTIRNYPMEAWNNCMRQAELLRDVTFVCCEYNNLDLADKNCVIYCDPPYRGTKEYARSGFNSDKFFDWCREMAKDGHKVFVSEYEAPDDFELLWEKDVSSSLRSNHIISGNKVSTERLFTPITTGDKND